MSKIFTHDDVMLPGLALKSPCTVKVEITEEFVILHVGPRDWQWRLSDSSFVGCGTMCADSPNDPMV